MNRSILILILMFVLTGLTNNLYALGGYEVSTSPTVGALYNSAQDTVVSAEAVFYNPSTTAFLEDGHHLYVGAFAVAIDYRMTFAPDSGGSKQLSTNDPQPVPSFSYVHKKGDNSYYLTNGTATQGGFMTYDSNLLSDGILGRFGFGDWDLSTFSILTSIGMAHKFSDRLSLSVGGRVVYSETDTEGSTFLLGNKSEFKTELDALGFAGEIGVYYEVNEKWALGSRFHTKTKLDFDGSISGTSDFAVRFLEKYYKDQRKDLPAVWTLGTHYKFNDSQSFYLGYKRLFESNMDMDFYGDFKDTNEYAFSYKHKLNNVLALNFGYVYTDKGGNNDDVKNLQELNASTYGIGIDYKRSTNMTLSAGMAYIDYQDGNTASLNAEREEISIGVSVVMSF